MDDELAKSLGDYESLDDLRAKVRADLVDAGRAVHPPRVFRQRSSTSSPRARRSRTRPCCSEQELDEYLKDLDRRLREQSLTLEDYLKIQGKTKEEFREEVRPQAEKRLKRTLVLGKVVALEDLNVEEQEIDRPSTS